MLCIFLTWGCLRTLRTLYVYATGDNGGKLSLMWYTVRYEIRKYELSRRLNFAIFMGLFVKTKCGASMGVMSKPPPYIYIYIYIYARLFSTGHLTATISLRCRDNAKIANLCCRPIAWCMDYQSIMHDARQQTKPDQDNQDEILTLNLTVIRSRNNENGFTTAFACRLHRYAIW